GASGSGIEELLADNPDYRPPEAGYDRPIDFLELGKLPEVCDELLKAGFLDDEITNILGGNFRRVAEQVWK
ncbi:MAG: membrane dipeptidase, partial [Gammaproteobacteria bacterium]|nr:membrane dipeptidase [Gammaproteobacteria bacterium]